MGRRLVLNFVAPSTRHPSGGVAVVYEFACAMARRGHEVHLFHGGFFQGDVRGIEDIDWFEFDAEVMHYFPPSGAAPDELIPDADVIFGYAAERASLTRIGLPVVLIQGFGMLGHELEAAVYRSPCPKVCVATWLMDVARSLGVPENELAYVPVGLRTDKYRLVRPIEGRAPRVVWCYSAHNQKGPDLALEVLDGVRAAVPEAEAVLFGAVAPQHVIPDWIDYRTNPRQAELVDDIYNGAAVVLCTSEVEGFGLTSIEAMACGAALVTTRCGGSRDYAFDGRTALVEARGDRDALVADVVTLLRDEARRVEIARGGLEEVRRFRWDRSAELLEDFVRRYLRDPEAFGYRPPGPPAA